MQLSRQIVRRFGDRQGQIPKAVLRQVGVHMADAIAIGYAGSRSREGEPARQWLGACLAGSAGGSSTVLGHRARLPPALAAGANAASMHVLDFDDIHDAARLHPSSVCVPAALAVAEVASAEEETIVHAVASSVELMCRLGAVLAPCGTGPASRWFLTQLLGYLGASLAAGVVLGLDEDAMVSAIGLAYMQAAGGKEAANGFGANARGIYPAFAAMGGTHAALAARAGLAGPPSALDGKTGLFSLYLGGPLDQAAMDELLRLPEAADGWAFSATEIKPWPCCRLAQPYVAAARAVREAMPDRALIAVVDIAINASAGKLCEPLQRRCQPTTLQDAKYSIPFLVAFTLVHGDIGLDSLTAESLTDADVLDMAGRIRLDPCLADSPGHPPARVAVATTAGGRVESDTVRTLGSTPEEVHDKFMRCLLVGGIDGAPVRDTAWKLLTQQAALPRQAVGLLQAALETR
ncbi:MmgE/PrpD family protein [Cupriavidus sp. CP313]